MQPGLNKQLQPHEIKSYKHKIKNQAGSAPDTDTQRDNRRCITFSTLSEVIITGRDPYVRYTSVTRGRR